MESEKLFELREESFIKNNWFFDVEEKEVTNPSNSEAHEHNYIEMFLLLSGNVDYHSDKGRYDLEGYDFLIIPPHVQHGFSVIKKKPYHKLSFLISPQFLTRLSSKLTDLVPPFLKSSDELYLIRDPEFAVSLKNEILKVQNLYEEKPYGYDLLIDNTIRELFISMGRYFSERYQDVATPVYNELISL